MVCFTPPRDEQAWGEIQGVNADLVSWAIELGGTATGEHGVGVGKQRFMELEHGGAVEWMRGVKAVFDPGGILNPGKMI